MEDIEMCHPQHPSRKDFSDWEVWSVESLQLSALLGSPPAAESHFTKGSLYLVCEWDQVKLPGHFSSVRDRHWQIILAPPPLPHTHPRAPPGWWLLCQPCSAV